MNVDHLERSSQHSEATTQAALSRQPIALGWSSANVRFVWPILVLMVLLVLPLFLPPPRTGMTVDIGSEIGLNEYGESRQGFYLFDVNSPERDAQGETYRWTKPFSTLRLLNIFTLGSPLILDIRACSCRPTNVPDVETTLKINTFQPLKLSLGAQQRTYQMLIPQRQSDYGRDLYLEFQSTTFRLPGDDRDLGARLDDVGVSFVRPWSVLGMPPLVAWLLYVAAVVGVFIVAQEPRTRNHESTTRLSVLSSGFSVLTAAVLLAAPYVYRPHIFALPVVALMSSVAIYGALLVARAALHRIVLAGAGLWLVWSTQVLGHWMLDDAYISFHYAANLLAGNGLVFNPGERVEGYTNFLWTMIAAIPLLWRIDPTVPMSLLTLTLGIGITLLTYRWGLVLEGRKQSFFELLPACFAPLMLAINTPFLLYTARGSGMETALFTLLLAAGSLAIQRAQTARGAFGAGVLFALATMTRPDGILGVIAACAYLFIRWMKEQGKQTKGNYLSSFVHRLSSCIPFLLGFLVLFVPYYLWRYAYYGYPLPNTFYAKVGTGWAQIQRGIAYTNTFAATIGWRFVALLIGGGVVATFFHARRNERRKGKWLSHVPLPSSQTLHLVLIVALYSAYTVAVGGDHFPGFRFFVPILPPLALLIQKALVAIAGFSFGQRPSLPGLRFLPALGATILALIYLAFTAVQLPSTDIGVAWSDIRGENNVVEKNRELGLWLRDNTPQSTVVATGIAGALPFYSGLRVIDTLGLNDLHIAHLDVRGMGTGEAGAEKTDVPYVLEQRPDYIPYSTSGTFQGYPRFKSDYAPIEVRGPEGRAMRLYRRTSP